MPDDLVFRRVRAMGADEQLSAEGKLRLLASTSDPVSWGDWREVLCHDDGAIDSSAARSLLVNHDPDQLAGGISDMRSDGSTLTSDAEIDDEARMRSGVSVRKSVAKRRLNGVSIGYAYEKKDTSFDEETRTLTVHRWRLLEISLTPIPADARAQVRSFPFERLGCPAAAVPPSPIATIEASGTAARAATADALTPAAPAATQEVRVSDPKNDPKPQGNDVAATTTKDEGARAAVIAEQRDIAQQARSLGLDAADFVGHSRESAKDAMLVALAKRNATPAPKEAPVALARVDYDQEDKARDAFTGALAHRAGVRTAEFDKANHDNPMIGGGLRHSVLEYARMLGIDTRGWSDKDAAYYALGKRDQMSLRAQRSVNVTSGQFTSFVFLNAITKIVARGFEMGSQTARYGRIVAKQTVPDFKQFSIGSLSSGNLVKTAEAMVFPELDKAEGVYSSTAQMWGGTISLSLQALVNDDTAQFDRLLRMAGSIADKTIDRRVFQKLLMGTSTAEGTATWTNNTTSGGSLVYTTADLAAAARGKLAIVRAAFINKAGKDGNPYGNLPRFLVVGPTREVEALAITGGSGPALQAGEAQPATRSLEVIATPWLEASALTGFSTTSYYLLADPNEVSTLVLSFVRGFDTVQVQPYDAGATAGYNWKLWLPFEADLVSDQVSGTRYFPGAHQGTT